MTFTTYYSGKSFISFGRTCFDMNSSRVFLAFLTLVLLPGLLHQTACATSEAPDEYAFYGYAPPTVKPIYYYFASTNHGPRHRYVGSPPQLTIVGVHDGTSVEVYDLNDKGMIASLTINRMEFRRISLANDTYFKVVSGKLVSVLLSGGGWKEWGGHGASAFYPCTDGGYVGYEFIFAPINSTNVIFFIEDAHVTIQDAEASVIAELEGTAGETRTIHLERLTGEADFLALKVYRVVSTGRILIAALATNSFLYLPCLTGGFVGKQFLAVRGDFYTTISVALDDAEIVFYDVKRPGWHKTLFGPDLKLGLSAGEWHNISDIRTPMRIDSTGNISILIGDGGGWYGSGTEAFYPEHMGDDMSLVVVRPGQKFGFFVPTEALLFAHEESTIDIDVAKVKAKKDEYFRLAQGVHVVKADAPITIEILGHGWEREGSKLLGGDYLPNILQQYDNYASYLVSYQGFRENYPEPPTAGGLTEIMPYLAISLVITMFLVVAIFIRKRFRKLT